MIWQNKFCWSRSEKSIEINQNEDLERLHFQGPLLLLFLSVFKKSVLEVLEAVGVWWEDEERRGFSFFFLERRRGGGKIKIWIQLMKEEQYYGTDIGKFLHGWRNGPLSAYSLFYVGRLRARKNLSIKINKREIMEFEDKLIKKFEECGFFASEVWYIWTQGCWTIL